MQQVAFYLAGEITQNKELIPWVRCASGNVFPHITTDSQSLTEVYNSIGTQLLVLKL